MGLTKVCKTCKQEQPKDSFICRSLECRSCKAVRERHRRQTDPEYRRKALESAKYSRRKSICGVTREDFDNRLAKQNYCCAICKVELDSSRKALIPCADHNHSNKKFRGVLCGSCNTGLGMFNDHQGFLLEAIQYLRENS